MLSEFSVTQKELKDLTKLWFCSFLEHLNVGGCHRLTDLSPIKGLQRLSWIDISDTSVADPFTTFSQMSQLTEVQMIGRNGRDDLRELKGATKLKTLEGARTALTGLERTATSSLREKANVGRYTRVRNLFPFTAFHHNYVGTSFTSIADVGPLHSFDAPE
ncbi:hypothetical protein ABB37_09589 [Leptomonas pyrrhocoris]|uniref:Uncharacterized protein n=1 Tax=Leptomonas pyrrhocoris TaxID=157538 RepID=A0A0N0DR70_LEPPY|nr:hypothetical protein ABB37_09589 [Leptomonas pyrrhocoris]KPA74034.1 hypothetical protein ABB37_09589 [Leptomonas pyrrhocoris]|eukprot:XP_015652473.1 hypothetical protein ABB37_09589 [Leptomonas pyrrhocoris]